MTMNTVSTSMFYMWRCIIAIAHADGVIAADERKFLGKAFDAMTQRHGLTAEQLNTFHKDMETPQRLADLLSHINDPEYRGMLVVFGEQLAMADGNVSPEEEEILAKLHAEQMEGLDLEQLRTEIRSGITRNRSERRAEINQLRQEILTRSPWLRGVDALMLKIGIDMLE